LSRPVSRILVRGEIEGVDDFMFLHYSYLEEDFTNLSKKTEGPISLLCIII
jgi:hypothetical protein